MSTVRRPWRTLLERDVAEVERRLRLYRANTPKRIAEETRLHPNTISTINLGRHPIQARLATELDRRQEVQLADHLDAHTLGDRA